MFDRELWAFLNSFADWLSAFGTIAAVIMALYLARRDSRIMLNVDVGIRLLPERSGKAEFFWIEVTNAGRRPAQIAHIVMRDRFSFGVERFQFSGQIVMPPPHNMLDFGTTLSDGERASMFSRWSEFEGRNHDVMRTKFGGRFGWVRARLAPPVLESKPRPAADSTPRSRRASRIAFWKWRGHSGDGHALGGVFPLRGCAALVTT